MNQTYERITSETSSAYILATASQAEGYLQSKWQSYTREVTIFCNWLAIKALTV